MQSKSVSKRPSRITVDEVSSEKRTSNMMQAEKKVRVLYS